MKQTVIKRGDIFWVNFAPSQASEIQKTRPAMIISNDVMNANSSRVIVAPITSNLKKVYSFEYEIKGHAKIKGKIMLDQLRAIDKSRLGEKTGALSMKESHEVGMILKFVLGVQ